jgi:tRNA (guanine37-N1)-methyltransferase
VRKRLKRKIIAPDSAGLPNKLDVYSSFDVVGDIAIIKLPQSSQTAAKTVAQTVIGYNKGIKTVLLQESKVSGKYRLRSLSWVLGENKTRTIHKEHGCLFVVDLEKSYFSPRLSGERKRIANLVEQNEVVVNMFAGVGCFSILIAKQMPSAKVYSIDINPQAIADMEDTIRRNRVFGNVIPILGDSKEVIEAKFQLCADRVLMPLPEKALEYLPIAVSALRSSGGWIHYHGFEHAVKGENPLLASEAKVSEKLDHLGVDFEVPFSRIVRPIGPNWYHIVLDIKVHGKF